MKHFLLLTSSLFTFNAFSQVTIDQNDFPIADDTAMISISDETMLDFTTTGADVIWDFSDLHILDQRIDTFYNPSDASVLYQLQFNNIIFEPDYASDYFQNLVGFDLAGVGGVGISINKPVSFVKISSSAVQNVGLGLELNGTEVPMASDTIDTEYELPMDYTDTWTSDSYIYVDLNPAFNGIFIRYQDRSSEVDGWGEITTRFGTFDVIRVKSMLTYVDSVYIDLGFGGTWIELPTPPQNEYTWWSEGNKVPVMRITTQDIAGTETVTRVEFKDKERNLADVEENVPFAGSVYPNPATNNVRFTFDPTVKQMIIYSVTGEVVLSHTITEPTMNIDVDNWMTGVYLVKLIGEDNVSGTTLVVE